MNPKEIQKLLEDNKETLNTLVEGGFTRESAIEAIEIVAAERDLYIQSKEYVIIPRELEVTEFEKTYGDIEKIDPKFFDKTLYELGFDTKVHKPVVFHKVVRNPGNKVYLGRFIMGQERIDKKWVEKTDSNGVHYASHEARDEYRNLKDYTRKGHLRDTFRT